MEYHDHQPPFRAEPAAPERDKESGEPEKCGESIGYSEALHVTCWRNKGHKGKCAPAYDPKESGEQVKRYALARLRVSSSYPSHWDEDKNGPWVKTSDHLSALSTLQERVEKLEKERDEAYAAIEGDRSIVADGVSAMKRVLDGRHWLTEGRGSYEWDDDRWHSEFKAAGLEMIEAMRPLQNLAADLSNSPKDSALVIKSRKFRAESAELSLSTLRSSFAEIAERAAEKIVDKADNFAGAVAALPNSGRELAQQEVKAIILAEMEKEQKC